MTGKQIDQTQRCRIMINKFWFQFYEDYPKPFSLLLACLGVFLGGIIGRIIGVFFEGEPKPYTEILWLIPIGKFGGIERSPLEDIPMWISVLLPILLILILAVVITDVFTHRSGIVILDLVTIFFFLFLLPLMFISGISWVLMEALSGKNLVDDNYFYASEPMVIGELFGEIIGLLIAIRIIWFLKQRREEVTGKVQTRLSS